MLIIKNCNLINMAGIYKEKKDLVVKDVGDQGEGDSGLLQDPSGFIGAVLAFDLALAADGGAQQALGVVFL